MPFEIEKKFLVTNDSWKEDATSMIYCQGYLCSSPGRTVRIRIAGDRGFLTIKGKRTGIRRLEFEYPIPLEEARELLETFCEQPLIHKRRYLKMHGGFLWEIDEFHGDNEGLVLAEIELEDERQEFPRPSWLGKEVSKDRRYYNARLRVSPYKDWKDEVK